jgi:hypothetical protein
MSVLPPSARTIRSNCFRTPAPVHTATSAGAGLRWAERTLHTRWVTSLVDAVRERVVVLDGGLATELERRGNDLSSVLWSARLLRDDPDEIVAAHRAFAAAAAVRKPGRGCLRNAR